MTESTFANGRFISITLYFVTCVIATIEALIRSENPYSHVYCVLYTVVSMFILFLIKPGLKTKRVTYERIQSLCYIMINLGLYLILKNISILLFLFLVQSLIMLVFQDKKIYYFQTIAMIVVFSTLGMIDYFFGSFIEELTGEHVIGMVCVLVGQWVCICIVQLFNSQKQHMMEQEQSMDDMIRLMEIKCIEARHATQSKSDFLSNMSHEIRTPINSVLGMNEMILRESHDKNIIEYASNIESSGRMLLSQINDVLDFSKIESGNMEIVPTSYYTIEFLNDLINLFLVPVRDKGLGFTLEIDNNLPRELYGDDVRLRQIFTNLLTNAIKYTEKGTVTLKIEGEMVNDFKVILHCEVRDTGIGIKEEDLPNLFKAFQRVEKKRNRKIIGTGLGLSITYHTLEQMGSRLKVDSIYGEGSTFYFSLVQDIVDETPIDDFKAHMKSHSDVRNYQAGLFAPDAKVLVVDDNEMNRKVFINLLKAPQVQVTQADSGKECLRLVKQENFDIIFLDHMMPEMDGIETLHELQKLDELKQTAVVALTANAISGAREMYLKEGFDEFLSKPIMPDKLEHLLIDILPDEKLLEVPEEVQEEVQEVQEIDLPMIDGLDWNFAMIHFPDKKMLLHTVEDFYKMIVYEAEKLEGFYKNIEEEGQMDAYRIQVHGMKSAAALIGIIPLSGCAKMLEDAAKREDLEMILSMTPLFLREWRGFKERLSPLDSEPEESVKTEDNSELLALLGMLQGAADGMDIDTMDEIVGKLPQYRFPENSADKVDQLSVAVMNLETEKIIDITNDLMDRIKN